MTRTTIVGVGALGRALAEGLAAAGSHPLTLFDRTPAKCVGVNAQVATSLTDAVINADLVVLAVKPKDTCATLAALASALPAHALVASAAAGISLRALQDAAPAVHLARIMPNLAAAVRQSVTATVLGASADPVVDRQRLEAFGIALGTPIFLSSEAALHVATALTGSGPAYFLLAHEAMLDAAVALGVPRQEARPLVDGALHAAAWLAATGSEPAAIRGRITSPAGTTAAGLQALEEHGARTAFAAAVNAATARSQALGQPSPPGVLAGSQKPSDRG